ncbi:hypothetical protein MVEN_01294000 [Mycena venus]|uniref:Uncharacterized protein n=1 Tax=Mycena venus TaxID=2733690 RepID=A0A8H7CVQ5_9AGAR|nr:hypothetical protein MVEN_01294000 [Mycena venus]
MDSTPDFADSQSQGPRHYSNAYDTAHDYGFEPSSDPHSDDSQNTIQGDELTVFVDLLANNYKLDIELRSDLHSFLDVARSLPPLQLKIALIQQATALSNQQVLLETKAICSTVHEVVSKVYKSLSDNLKITKEQMSEITAACKTHFFTGRRFEFSNDDFKVDVIPYLEQHADTNGLAMIFEDKTRAHHKLLVGKVGLAASNTKTWLRRTLVNSLPDPKKNNRGVSVTTLATYLSNKCLGDSKHVRAKHAIWLIIIRFFIHHNEDLWFIVSTDNAAVDDDELEFPTSISTVPAKRAHTGAVVAQNSDGKRIEHFWRQITVLWKARNKLYKSSDLRSQGWSNFISDCVREELQLFPTDRLALIIIATPTLFTFGNSSNSTSPSIPSFTFGSAASSRSSVTLPPLSSLGESNSAGRSFN